MTVRVEITSYSGFVTPPTVAVPQPQKPEAEQMEPQGRRDRPTLRLVK